MEHGKLAELILWGAGVFLGSFLMRIGWIRAKGAKELPSITEPEKPNGNGGYKNGSVGRDEFNDLLLELGEVKGELGKVTGQIKGLRHCEHCYRRPE